MGQHELKHQLQMTEQIVANFGWESDDERAVAAIAAHIQRFWTPSMRAQMKVHASAQGELSPRARAAIARLV